MTAQALITPLPNRYGSAASDRDAVTAVALSAHPFTSSVLSSRLISHRDINNRHISNQHISSQQKGRWAHWALLEEARLTPKPALVDRRSSGAHADMSLALMETSAQQLAPYFAQMAAIPMHLPLALRRQQLGILGREAEAAMLQATGGINTHRGAIWALGLLVASPYSTPVSLATLLKGAATLAQTSDPLAPPAQDSHGRQVCQRYQVGGARAQAEAGFPAIALQGMPTLRASRARGDSEPQARLNALLAMMTQLTDTCVLYRAGPTGLEAMQVGAQAVLEAGGVATRQGQRALNQLDHTLRTLNASAGGAADLLAATLLADRLCSRPSGLESASRQELL